MDLVADMDNTDFFEGQHENPQDDQEENVVQDDHDEEAKSLVDEGKNLLEVVQNHLHMDPDVELDDAEFLSLVYYEQKFNKTKNYKQKTTVNFIFLY